MKQTGEKMEWSEGTIFHMMTNSFSYSPLSTERTNGKESHLRSGGQKSKKERPLEIQITQQARVRVGTRIHFPVFSFRAWNMAVQVKVS